MGASDILVVGGSGFIGGHVVRRLLAADRRVTVFAPAAGPGLNDEMLARITFVEGSIEDRQSVTQALRDSGAATVVSLAAYGEGGRGLLRAAAENADKAFRVNVDGFRNLLEAAAEHGVRRLLWSSSTTVFGNPSEYESEVVAEDAPRRPSSLYGLTKALAEQAAAFYRDRRGLVATALRLPLIFGPGLWYAGAAAEIAQAFEAAAAGRSFTLGDHGRPFDLMYVKDVAALFAHMAQSTAPPDPVYNVAGFATTTRDLAAAIAAAAGVSHEITARAAGIAYPLMSAEKLRREAGFRPAFDLQHAVADYLAEISPTRDGGRG